jgi:2-oxoisovalerate dehydrogenase E2 component (dihydrolipoyl transacylase)
MESPVAGKVVEVAGEVGDVIAIGSPLVVLETEGDVAVTERPPTGSGGAEVVAESACEPAVQPAVAPPPSSPPTVEESRPEPKPEPEPEPARPEPVEGRSPGLSSHAKVLASPAVRARAKELGIDLADIHPADDGRIRHADLDAFLSYGGAKGYASAGQTGRDETIKVVGLRRRIAENMAASKRNIPHFAYVEECDVTELDKLRADLNANRGPKSKLTLLPLLIVALCRALPRFPMLNARYDDEANIVTRYGAVHLGMATMTDAGLMVPVIRDAQAKNLWQLAAEIVRLSEAAREGKAKLPRRR